MSQQQPLPPELVNGPTEADEEDILRALYGEPDEDGIYRGDAEEDVR